MHFGRHIEVTPTEIGSMELRHLSCLVAVAEELHLARAAERPHIEQSPLSNEKIKRYSQMKLQMKREALEKINRQANEMPLDSGTAMVQ